MRTTILRTVSLNTRVLRSAVSTAFVCGLALSTAAAPEELRGDVCVERIVVGGQCDVVGGKCDVVGGQCDEAPAWEANFTRDLNRPYGEMGVQLKTTFKCREVRPPDSCSAKVALLQGIALADGWIRVGSQEYWVAKDASFAEALLASEEGIGVGDAKAETIGYYSTLLFGSNVQSKVPGITVTTSPQNDFGCNLEREEAAYIAMGSCGCPKSDCCPKSGCCPKSDCCRKSDCDPVRMLIVPTKFVLCHWAASGYESMGKDSTWLNTSFIPMTRTDPASGLYRKFLAPHELGHVLLDGGAGEVHSADTADLMYRTGGQGVIPRQARRRIVKESGPDADPPLLHNTESPGASSSSGRSSSLRTGPPIPERLDADRCSCTDTASLRASLPNLATSLNLVTAFLELSGFLRSEVTPVAVYPALASIFDEEPVFEGLTAQQLLDTFSNYAAVVASGWSALVDEPDDPAGGKRAALLIEAAGGSVVGTEGLVKACADFRQHQDDVPWVKVRESLEHVCAAEDASQAWKDRFAGRESGEDSTRFLERYVRQGFEFNTGAASLDLYGGGQPVVRWARRKFAEVVTRRSQIRVLWEGSEGPWKTPVYKAYLEQLAGL